jgi:aldehyde dehydrogenase (NAD+)
MMERYYNFIGGEWKPSHSQKLFKDINPADTRDVIGLFPDSTREDAKEAIDSAKEAQKSWADLPAPQRGKILLKASILLEENVEELVNLLTREEGKTLKESKGEVTRAIEVFRFFASLGYRLKGETIPSAESRTFIYTIKEPIGVASIITPWNFPIAIPAWKIAPALIAGNSVVFKPSPLTPLIGQRLVEILEKAGLPKGVINLVQGGAEVGREMTTNDDVDVVSFTGSYAVGSEIWRSCSKTHKMIRYQLEMGGKNPLVILRDADLAKAVEIAVKGAFGVTGQACTASSRILVEDEIYDRFLEAFINRASSLRVGNGLKDVDMGPVVSEQQLNKDMKYIRIGKEEGAKLVLGGERLDQDEYKYGYFLQPTIFAEMTKDMRIAKEEIFGPIAGVMRVKDLDEAIEVANSVDYGLCASICTSNLTAAHEFVNRVEAGVIKVNKPTIGLELQAPFGGYKNSSSLTFKEQGEVAIEIYTKQKTVYLSF